MLAPYLVPSEELSIPTILNAGANVQTRRVWVGPAVDTIRLDVMNVGLNVAPGDVPQIFMELRATAGDLGVGVLLASGNWTVNPNDSSGFLVQCTGIISDGFEVKLATEAAGWSGAPIKLGLRATLVRLGAPVSVVRGLLLP